MLDWGWLKQVFRRSDRERSGEVRFNRAFDIVLFIGMVVVIYSGFLVSESILPNFGIDPEATTFSSNVHDASGNLLILFVGIHMPWIKRNIGRIRTKRAAS